MEAVVDFTTIPKELPTNVRSADALMPWANAQHLTTNVFGATRKTISNPNVPKILPKEAEARLEAVLTISTKGDLITIQDFRGIHTDLITEAGPEAEAEDTMAE